MSKAHWCSCENLKKINEKKTQGIKQWILAHESHNVQTQYHPCEGSTWASVQGT
jgi:hypothetical protein